MIKTIQAVFEAALMSYLPFAFVFMDLNPVNWSNFGRGWCTGFFMFLLFIVAIRNMDEPKKPR